MDGERRQVGPPVDHHAERVGELQFPLRSEIVLDHRFEAGKEQLAVPDVVDANDRQVGYEGLRLFHQAHDPARIFLHHPEARGILNRMDPDRAVSRSPYGITQITLEDRVPVHDKNGVPVGPLAGQEHRVPQALRVVLLDRGDLTERVALPHEVDDLLAHLADHQRHLRDAQPNQLIEDIADNRLARDVEQGLGGRMCVGTQAGSHACCRYHGPRLLEFLHAPIPPFLPRSRAPADASPPTRTPSSAGSGSASRTSGGRAFSR